MRILIAVYCGVLLGATPGLVAPSVSGAVRITQHIIPVLKIEGETEEVVSPASAIFSGPSGLLVVGARATEYQLVTTGPKFAVSAGVGSGVARSFFIGPDGQTWFLSNIVKGIGKAGIAYPTINEVTPGGSAVKFTYPSPTGSPLSAVTGPDGAVWMAQTSASTLDRWVPGSAGVSSFALPVGGAGPIELISGPGGELWSTDIVTGAIGQISPEGKAVEHLLPGPGYGVFSDVEPYGLVAAPDGAVWFTEQNAAAIGRITPAGELQTFPIAASPGVYPGAIGYPQPRNLAVGPERAIWFTDPGTNSIGRVAGGQVSEFPIVGAENAVPDSIVTVGGELWFDEEGAPLLGSVNPALTASEPTISAAEIKPMLAVTGPNATIPELLENAGYTTRTTLPGVGTMTITWMTSKHTLIARGKETLSAAGIHKLKIKLTPAGKKLLKKSKTLKITAKGTVTLTGVPRATANRSFTAKQ